MKGRAWSLIGFWTGIGASVSANVAHTYIRHAPPAGAVLSSAFWPLALLITVEIISRVDWPEGKRYWLIRYAGLTTVAMIAAIISYSHMAALLLSYGEGTFTAHIGPIACDGLTVVASVALIAIADNKKRTPIIGRVELT